MPTESQIKKLFWQIFERLPGEYRTTILRSYRRDELVIVTNEEKFPHPSIGYIDKAGTIAGMFYFRLSRLSDTELNEVILHELLHLYVELRDNLKWADFQLSEALPFEAQHRVRRLRRRVEREVSKMTRRLLKALKLEDAVAQTSPENASGQ